MNNLIEELYDYLQGSSEYDFLPRSHDQIIIERKVAAMDEDQAESYYHAMSEWQRYGFRNGFAYAVQLLMDCHI